MYALILKLEMADTETFLGSKLKAGRCHDYVAKNIKSAWIEYIEVAEIWFIEQLGEIHIIVQIWLHT